MGSSFFILSQIVFFTCWLGWLIFNYKDKEVQVEQIVIISMYCFNRTECNIECNIAHLSDVNFCFLPGLSVVFVKRSCVSFFCLGAK